MQTILLIKDDDISHFYKQILEENGKYQVVIAESGKAGLTLAHESPPAIIVLDAFLPDTTGLAVIQKIKREPELTHIPILILTGRGISEAKAQLLKDNCDTYLTKPFSTDRLRSCIDDLLEP